MKINEKITGLIFFILSIILLFAGLYFYIFEESLILLGFYSLMGVSFLVLGFKILQYIILLEAEKETEQEQINEVFKNE